MKTLLTLLLSCVLWCTVARGAAIDDQARSFLLNVVLNGADAWLTNGVGGLSNLLFSYTNLTVQLVATNSTVNSNLTFTSGIDVQVYATNNLSATNWNFTAGTKGEAIITFFPQLVNRTFVSPTLGTAQFGMFWNSNLDGTIGAWSTLTVGVKYVWAIKQRDTNFYSRMTAWK